MTTTRGRRPEPRDDLLLGSGVDATPTAPPPGYVAPAAAPAPDTPAPVDAVTPAGEDTAQVRWASETMVQATKLAMRAFARHRDALPERAQRAMEAVEDLRAAGGNDEQVLAVLADARVRLSELDAARTSWRPRRG